MGEIVWKKKAFDRLPPYRLRQKNLMIKTNGCLYLRNKTIC